MTILLRRLLSTPFSLMHVVREAPSLPSPPQRVPLPDTESHFAGTTRSALAICHTMSISRCCIGHDYCAAAVRTLDFVSCK